METSGHPEFEPQLSQDGLFCSSPLETLVRRASSRRQAAKQQTHRPGQSGATIPPALRPRHAPPQLSFAVLPPRPLANPHIPDSPLLHSNFRSSTASAATNITALLASQNSKSFLSFTDDCELDDGCAEDYYYGQQPQPSGSHNHYPTFATLSGPIIHHPESQTDLWQQACTGPTQPAATGFKDLMPPLPSSLPTVVVSSPQDDDPKSSGPMRQPIVSQSGSARLNFSRPGRPPIISSEEQKRHVLERNAQRANSPRTRPSPASFSPVTPLTGVYSEQLQTSRHLTSSESSASSYLRPDGFYPPPSHHPSNHVALPSHPPSLRAGSPSSLYSNSYSFYQLDSAVPSPISLSPQSSPDVSPATSRPVSAEPQTPEDYLQLGIRYHEGNQLKDSAFYFEKSAREQGGCGVGMLMWGLTLRHGWGCEKNEKGGFKWLTKAAESAVDDLEKAKKGLDVKGVKEELVLAIYEVGQCFFQGWGVPKDQKMAVSYYRVSARLGDADAQQDLAFCLANGKGCKKDKKEAARWYRAAVAQGASDVGMAWIYKDKYKD
ncbi:hypothetical protein JVU11DRAFT_9374 [Chiua virens]|nr:hypothetical protein JVU11DRAFT_9374 [Chiua virens]